MEKEVVQDNNTSIPEAQPEPQEIPQPATQTTEAPKQKPWLIIGITALVLLLLGATGFFVYQNYRVKKQTSKAQPTPAKFPSPAPKKPSEEIKIIDGNICQVTAPNEIKILVDKNDYQSESISGFDKVIISPDGTKMCFLGYSPVPVWLYYSNIDGSNVFKAGIGENCVWSPDSQKIAFNNHVTDISPIDVLVVDTDSDKVENLTKEVAPEGFIRYYGIPQWSKDAMTITANFKSVSMPDEAQRENGTSTINLLTKEIVDK